jgi:hypothetical protein
MQWFIYILMSNDKQGRVAVPVRHFPCGKCILLKIKNKNERIHFPQGKYWTGDGYPSSIYHYSILRVMLKITFLSSNYSTMLSISPDQPLEYNY